MKITKVMQRIFNKTIVDENNCWNYTGYLRNGYAFTCYKGRCKSGSRVVMIELTGLYENDPTMFACHKCNNRACVNPDHLYWGTRSENTKDAVRAGTNNLKDLQKGGEDHPNALLTNDLVKKLREINQKEGLGPKGLSKIFGINHNTINNILYNKNRFKGV